MIRTLILFAVFLAAFFTSAAQAQDRIWVQIEAQPSLAEAEARARAYAAIFPETVGYRMRSGWYAIALGPYAVGEGAAQLAGLRRENLIPSDSFITDGSGFTAQFWPGAGDVVPPAAEDPEDVATAEPQVVAPVVPLEPAELPDETRAEARQSEAALLPEERKILQTALQWFGFYQGGIDGAFGPGTRNSMAAWQTAQALDPTGILTTRQRETLLSGYRNEVASFGFATVTEETSGIEVTLPLNLVAFDRYEPPFVHYRAKDNSGIQIMLISQPGDQSSLYGLYDILQSLKLVPLTGERSRSENAFRIRGTSDTTDTTATAELRGGRIKGWILVSTPGNSARDTRIIQAIEAGFKSSSDAVLDPGLVAMSADAKRGMLAGLELRKPKFSRSGFFVDATGAVLTTAEAVTGCGRITVDRDADAVVTLSDEGSGLALLKPKVALSPRAVAAFQSAADQIGSDMTLAGFSYEGALPAPALTLGTLEDVTGLNGETGVRRLKIDATPGDTGGPVLNRTGAVVGLLLSAAGSDKQLPAGVFFAASAATISDVLTRAGLSPLQSSGQTTLSPTELSAAATGMTTLVSCWE